MAKTNAPALGQVLADIRISGGLTQEQLGKALGYTASYISRLESGGAALHVALTPESVEMLMRVFELDEGDVRLYEACMRSFAEHSGPWGAEFGYQVFGWKKPKAKEKPC